MLLVEETPYMRHNRHIHCLEQLDILLDRLKILVYLQNQRFNRLLLNINSVSDFINTDATCCTIEVHHHGTAATIVWVFNMAVLAIPNTEVKK